MKKLLFAFIALFAFQGIANAQFEIITDGLNVKEVTIEVGYPYFLLTHETMTTEDKYLLIGETSTFQIDSTIIVYPSCSQTLPDEWYMIGQVAKTKQVYEFGSNNYFVRDNCDRFYIKVD